MTHAQFTELLKTSQSIDIPALKKEFTLKQIEENIKEIIKSEKEYELVKTNNDYRENLLLIITYLLTLEQNELQKNSKEVSLKTKTFDENLTHRINLLL